MAETTIDDKIREWEQKYPGPLRTPGQWVDLFERTGETWCLTHMQIALNLQRLGELADHLAERDGDQRHRPTLTLIRGGRDDG